MLGLETSVGGWKHSTRSLCQPISYADTRHGDILKPLLHPFAQHNKCLGNNVHGWKHRTRRLRVHAGSSRAYNRWTSTHNCHILKALLKDFARRGKTLFTDIFSGTYWEIILKLYSLKSIGVCLKTTTYALDKSTHFACHCSINASPRPRRLLMVPLHDGNPD
jgi:hypothetical protein